MVELFLKMCRLTDLLPVKMRSFFGNDPFFFHVIIAVDHCDDHTIKERELFFLSQDVTVLFPPSGAMIPST